MATNDRVLIDGIIDDMVNSKIPSDRRDEAFEHFSFEQILKDTDPSDDEIKEGNVDGRNDGGIDGFFIIVNGSILSDLENFNWPKTGAELDVWIINCKHQDTFKQAPVDNLFASLSELFNFSISKCNLRLDYPEKILNYRENLQYAYRKLSPRLKRFSINVCYASRGDTSIIGESILSRSKQVEQIALSYFSKCISTFSFYGATELVELHRKKHLTTLELPFCKVLSSGERYILLANLSDYYDFVSDPESGKLRRYLFDSNVRDFMGLNNVNEDIKSTLEDEDSPDFWWLNNGVTILSTSASLIGNSILLQDIQIVNGLQTTESVYNYFLHGGKDSKKRSVLIKIIVSTEDVVRDAITKATNNQTNVELSSLHATDKIQRDIEDVLLRSNIYYDRRKNYYKNLGHLSSDIISPLYIASGFVSLILKSPFKGTTLRNKFMRSEEAYNTIFSFETPLNVWPQIATSLKKTDMFLEAKRPTGKKGNEFFLKKQRHITCFILVSKIFGKFDFSINELINLEQSKVSENEFQQVWSIIKSNTVQGRTRSDFIKLCTVAASEFGITGLDRIEREIGALNYGTDSPRMSKNPKLQDVVGMDFALKLNTLLPDQPWKPGLHKKVSKELKCTTGQYFAAVKMLIDEGIRHRQKDGVVYDNEGNIITFDSSRVNSETMELISVEMENE